MAIQLNGDGLSLNYPTSLQSSAVNVPVGCAVIYKCDFNEYSLNGTWAMLGVGSSISGYGRVGSKVISSSGSSSYVYSLAIRVA